jgi:hypothetical protein
MGAAKCAWLVLHVPYVAGASLCRVKAKGIVRASCIVIAVSACWLINCAFARTPLGTRAGGMITTGDLVPRFLVERHFSVVVWLGSVCINSG